MNDVYPIDEIEDDLTRAEKVTAGPWFLGYSAIHSKPISDEYMRIEGELPDNLADDDPRWDLLPDSSLAFVPVIGGDTPTTQGAIDGKFIAEAREKWPRALLALKNALEEIKELRELLGLASTRWQEADWHWTLEFGPVTPNVKDHNVVDLIWTRCQDVLKKP